jgi:hypothetical protein
VAVNVKVVGLAPAGQENCHTVKKSGAVVPCKEMLVIPVEEVVERKE